MPSGPAATLCIGVSICAEAWGSSLTPKSGQDINLGLLRTISSFSDTDDALDALPLRDCLLPAPLAPARGKPLQFWDADPRPAENTAKNKTGLSPKRGTARKTRRTSRPGV